MASTRTDLAQAVDDAAERVAPQPDDRELTFAELLMPPVKATPAVGVPIATASKLVRP
jgi:hypothetical protein